MFLIIQHMSILSQIDDKVIGHITTKNPFMFVVLSHNDKILNGFNIFSCFQSADQVRHYWV